MTVKANIFLVKKAQKVVSIFSQMTVFSAEKAQTTDVEEELTLKPQQQ